MSLLPDHQGRRAGAVPGPAAHLPMMVSEDDHLSQVANIRSSQIRNLASVGVTTLQSLANCIAAGTAAKNLVLVGDQMQLSQPSPAVHPGESGKSTLDYLLQGRHTIPVEEGILLDTTYRTHPSGLSKLCVQTG